MYAQDHKELSDMQNSSDGCGACDDRGARNKSARVFFEFLAEGADRVYLTGDFNGWRENLPMLRGDGGMWQTSIRADEISDGDTYKYKVYVNGKSFFVSDPRVRENNGEPYFNSVYRESALVLGSDLPCNGGSTYVNIYAVEADSWAFGASGEPLPYEMLANELLPYLLQMGYTHVSLSHVFVADSGYPQGSQGSMASLRELICKLQAQRIKVLIVAEHSSYSARNTAERLTDCLESLGADGILIDLPRKNDIEFYYELFSSIKQRKRDTLVVANVPKGEAAIPADVTVRECPTCEGDLHGIAAGAAEVLLIEGKMITHAGQELGLSSRGEAVDWRSTSDRERACLQLFLSKLNHACVSSDLIVSADVRAKISQSERFGTGLIKRESGNECLILLRNTSDSSFEIALNSEYSYELLVSTDVIYRNHIEINRNTVRLERNSACVIKGEKTASN